MINFDRQSRVYICVEDVIVTGTAGVSDLLTCLQGKGLAWVSWPVLLTSHFSRASLAAAADKHVNLSKKDDSDLRGLLNYNKPCVDRLSEVARWSFDKHRRMFLRRSKFPKAIRMRVVCVRVCDDDDGGGNGGDGGDKRSNVGWILDVLLVSFRFLILFGGWDEWDWVLLRDGR